MKSSRNIFVMLMVLFGIVPIAQAVRPLGQRVQALESFISISVTPDKIDLGGISQPDVHNVSAKLKAHIIANIPHHVEASIAPFTHLAGGESIAPEDTTVEINGTNVPVAGSQVSIISSGKPTPEQGVDVPVDLRFSVKNAYSYKAGKYKSLLLLTIMPGP